MKQEWNFTEGEEALLGALCLTAVGLGPCPMQQLAAGDVMTLILRNLSTVTEKFSRKECRQVFENIVASIRERKSNEPK